MNFFEATHRYCLEHTSPVNEVLKALERETHLKTLKPQMLSGALQGQMLQFISKMMRPKHILEIGTFTGYSAICLAQGLQQGGILQAIEANEELEHIIRKYIRLSDLEELIELHIGDARHIIPTLEGKFDLVFIDAGKKDNAFYYDLVFDRVELGGFLLIDNVLWHGKVLNTNKDKDTKIIDDFNKKVQADERVANVMLPLRDGLLVVQKVKLV